MLVLLPSQVQKMERQGGEVKEDRKCCHQEAQEKSGCGGSERRNPECGADTEVETAEGVERLGGIKRNTAL